MKTVTTASLNQQPFFFEQDAFEHLASYLREAELALAQHPDRDEVLRDLEQAIAERCRAALNAQTSVVTLGTLTPILNEIGPVTDPAASKVDENPPGQAAGASSQSKFDSSVRPPLEQISEGALLSGVCMGLSRYFGIDVSLLRIAVIVLTLISAGLAIGLYALLMFLLPYAPVNLDAAPMGRWPRKIRGWVERLRGRLSGALR